MFYAKKILEHCLYPLSIILILLLIGLILLYCRKIRSGRIFILIGFILFLAASTPWLANAVFNSLQNQYPPLEKAPETIPYIVVLGGGFLPIHNIPENNLLTPSSSQRMIEGIRLWQQAPTAKIIFSGGDYYRQFSDADLMTKTAEMLGMSAAAIIDENQSLDTGEEVVLIKKIIKNSPFILITSAFHMPRAMELFEHQGMHPIAAPCDFQYVGEKHFLEFFPSLYNIGKLDTAIHEYQGLAWNKVTGK